MRSRIALTLVVLLAACRGCRSGSDADGAPAAANDGVFDEDATAEERVFLVAARPFVEAVASRRYAEAYALLSDHAKARLSPAQFAEPMDDEQLQRLEARAKAPASVADFVSFMGDLEDEYGMPAKVDRLYVNSVERAALDGTGDRLDVLFAIGAMPARIPADIRRASVRGQVLVRLSEATLAAVAQDEGRTVAELVKDPDFKPYFNVKLVLVDDAGKLKVGWFEFMRPGMLD